MAERLVALAGEAGVASNAAVYAIMVGLSGHSLVQRAGAFFDRIRRFEGAPCWTGLAHAVAVRFSASSRSLESRTNARRSASRRCDRGVAR